MYFKIWQLVKYHGYKLFVDGATIQTSLNFKVVEQEKIEIERKKKYRSMRSKYKWTEEDLELL